jgi:hypothetical protein
MTASDRTHKCTNLQLLWQSWQLKLQLVADSSLGNHTNRFIVFSQQKESAISDGTNSRANQEYSARN